MGCISCKLHYTRDLCYFSPKPILDFDNGDLPNHIVSLTPSTYGVLNLDPPENMEQSSSTTKVSRRFPPSIFIPRSRNLSFNDPSPEIINWTLGENFDDAGNDAEKIQLKTLKSSSKSNKSSSRRSLSPMFDPELVSFYERELQEESEQTKRILLTTTTSLKEEKVRDFLGSFEEKCPHGGEKVVVLYTTTPRGIRKTFNECNIVRSVIGSYDVCVIERDVSMDLGFREEMRMLIGSKDARPPVLFVKGRMVGGVVEVMRLEEEGKLGLLLEGIPKAVRSCEDCGGLRFVICKVCNGSCKILVQGEKKKSECGECNENGLVQCASCSKIADGFPSILT